MPDAQEHSDDSAVTAMNDAGPDGRMQNSHVVDAASSASAPAQTGPSADLAPSHRRRDEIINQRLFETSLDLILIVDQNGNFLRVSPSVEAILGYRPDELIGKIATGYVHRDDLENTRQEMRLARRGKEIRNFDCRYVHKSGNVVTLAWTGVWNEAERQHFFIGRDMTERIRLERQLHQSQKLEAIGQLTGGIAHDFNNILTIVIGMNELLASSLQGDPHLAAICKSVDEAADRGAKLVQRMLAFARKQPLQVRTLDLNDIVVQMASMLEQALGETIKVETVLPEGLWRAQADLSEVENAIINLAVNARDAMPDGGRLLIETQNAHLDAQYASTNVDVTPGDYVSIVVSDTGSGIPPQIIERVFEPFFTTKDVGHGSGLGLSTVYGFAKQSRGHVKIYSELGHGTSVKLYLPRADHRAGIDVVTSTAVKTQAAGGETILVVEDDCSVRQVAVSVLKSLGYDVRQAADGWAALQIIEEPIKIDLLFTDMVMPNGIGGDELLRRARTLRPELKALFTSGYSEKFLRGRDAAFDQVGLLNKPYRRDKLASAIREALNCHS
jgi:PAS domain S-box-containing protein